MSALWTRRRIWPFLTVSPRRARISTTRPVASEITGTVREISGLTDPVAMSFDVEMYAAAVASGNCSGWSTCTTLASCSCSTLVWGGASALGSLLLSPQPNRNAARTKVAIAAMATFGGAQPGMAVPLAAMAVPLAAMAVPLAAMAVPLAAMAVPLAAMAVPRVFIFRGLIG